jgi:TPR repeat protein
MPQKSLYISLVVLTLSSLWFIDAQSANSDSDDSLCGRFNQSIREADAFLRSNETTKAMDVLNKGNLGFSDLCPSESLQRTLTTIAEQAHKFKNSDAMLSLAYFCQLSEKLSYKTEEYLIAAAKLGSVEAENALGAAYKNGYFGVYRKTQRDDSKAAFWWTKASDAGDANAKAYLADLYEEGDGVLQDFMKAKQLRLQAASKGQCDAMFALGDMYQNGRGVPTNFVLAYMWINLAAQKEVIDYGSKNDVTIRERNKAAARLNTANLLKAQEMSKVCLESNYKQCGE